MLSRSLTNSIDTKNSSSRDSRCWRAKWVLALVLVLTPNLPALAWNSGREDTPGPRQARNILPLWDVNDAGTTRSVRNEHGYLFKQAFDMIGATGLEVALTAEGPSFAIESQWLSGESFSGDGISFDSLIAQAPLATNVVREQRRVVNIATTAALADHSLSLWDWATGNESCPAAVGPDGASYDTVVKCHQLFNHLGSYNSTHFGAQAADTYRWYHLVAMEGAKHCKKLRDNLNGVFDSTNQDYINGFLRECQGYVLALEAFGQHFLQDAWAVGHMWPRWGAPTTLNFPSEAHALAVAAASGTIHGTENMLRIPDRMSSGTSEAFVVPDQPGVFNGIGDGRVDELINGVETYVEEKVPSIKDGAAVTVLTPTGQYSDKYQFQRERMYMCSSAGLAAIWRAMGGNTTFDPAQIDPIGPNCMGAENTNSAIYSGIGLFNFHEESSALGDPLSSGLSAYLIARLKPIASLEVLSKEEAVQFSTDFTKFAFYVAMAALEKPREKVSWKDLQHLTLGGVGFANEYLARTGDPYDISSLSTFQGPPAPYADPITLVTSVPVPSGSTRDNSNSNLILSQNRPINANATGGERINSERQLRLTFNKAHLSELCTDPEFASDPDNPNDSIGFALRRRVLAATTASERDAALKVCTEVVARHITYTNSSSSMCEVVNNGSDPYEINTTFSGNAVEGLSKLETAAQEWCQEENLSCTSSYGPFDFWSVSCKNEAGNVVTDEYTSLEELPGYTVLQFNRYPGGGANYDATAGWILNIVRDEQQPNNATLVEPTVLNGKTYWEDLNDQSGTFRRRTKLYTASYANSDPQNLQSAQLEVVEVQDRSNYVYIGKRCGQTGSVTYYETHVCNGSVYNCDPDIQVKEETEAFVCPTTGEGEVMNSIQLEDSIIYQCLTLPGGGKVHTACPLVK